MLAEPEAQTSLSTPRPAGGGAERELREDNLKA
jgi:hypothetical protein